MLTFKEWGDKHMEIINLANKIQDTYGGKIGAVEMDKLNKIYIPLIHAHRKIKSEKAFQALISRKNNIDIAKIESDLGRNLKQVQQLQKKMERIKEEAVATSLNNLFEEIVVISKDLDRKKR